MFLFCYVIIVLLYILGTISKYSPNYKFTVGINSRSPFSMKLGFSANTHWYWNFVLEQLLPRSEYVTLDQDFIRNIMGEDTTENFSSIFLLYLWSVHAQWNPKVLLRWQSVFYVLLWSFKFWFCYILLVILVVARRCLIQFFLELYNDFSY